jgi:hypothetical protein
MRLNAYALAPVFSGTSHAPTQTACRYRLNELLNKMRIIARIFYFSALPSKSAWRNYRHAMSPDLKTKRVEMALLAYLTAYRRRSPRSSLQTAPRTSFLLRHAWSRDSQIYNLASPCPAF